MAAGELIVGLVSVSDRASSGVYQDQGIPALRDWLRAQHPYEVPQLLTHAVQAEQDYVLWVAQQVDPASIAGPGQAPR